MRRAAQIFFALLLGAAVLALLLVLSLRTQVVRQEILHYALPPLGKLLGGAVRIGRLDGDLFGNLTLRDVEIDDAAGKPLIRAEQAYARYDLRKLLSQNYTLEEVRLSGGWVTFAPDDAGKLGLAGIGKQEGPPSPPSLGPVIHFERVTIDAEAVVPQRALSAMVHVEGALNVADQVIVRLDRGHAVVSPSAGFDLSGQAIIGAKTSLEGVVLDLHSDAARLLRLAGQAPMRGAVSLHAEGGGPLDALALKLKLAAPPGACDAKGVVDVFTGKFAAGGNLDLRRLRKLADRVTASFAASGDAAGLRVKVERLKILREQVEWRSRAPAHVEVVFGKTVKIDRLTLVSATTPPAEITAGATLAQQRAHADLSASYEGNSLHAQVDFPFSARAADRLAGQGRLAVAVDQRLFTRIRAAAPELVAKLAWLDGGRLNLTFQLGGTFADPEAALDGELTLAAPGPATGKAQLTARYAAGRAQAHFTAAVTDARGKNAGSFDANLATRLRVSLIGLHPRVEDSSPLEGGAKLSGLLLSELRAFGLTLPFHSGVVDATVDFAGDLAAPVARARVTARDLLSNQLKRLDLDLTTVLTPGQTVADLQIAVEGQAMAKLHASADLRAGLAHWRDAPLEAQLTLVPYPLTRIGWLAHGLDGEVRGTLDFKGSVAAPRATAKLRIDSLRLGAIHYDGLEMNALMDGRKLTAQALISNGGKILANATGSLPIEAGGKLELNARLEHLMVDLRSETLPALRAFSATIDGDAHVSGALTHPEIEAHVKIENGRLALQSSPTELTGLALDANWKNGQLVVDKLTVTADEGTASATARATLTGSRLDSLSAHLSTHRYPVSQQGLSAWLDSEIDVNAQRAGAHTKIQVAIRKALIELPELASEHPLQSIGPMDDVLFVGQAAEEAKPPPDIEVAITTPGAIQVRSPEAKLDLRLDLRVARAVGGLGVWGHIDGPNGQLTLLGRRYAVDRLHVSFDGAARPNPTLDVRVTRPMSDALMMVDVHGTANAPQVTFRSDPPIYTESQVLGEFISGDSESASVSTRSLDQQAIGAVSSLVVGKLKNELAPKLPIDLIKIDVGNEGYTDAGGAVEAGKYLTDNLYLAYVHQFGSAPGSRPINHNEGRLDLRFLRHMLLETHFGDAAVGGIDVFWTRRF